MQSHSLRLTIWIGRKIQNRRLRMITREHIFLLTNQPRSIKTLCHHFLGLAVPINHIIRRPLIVFAPNIYVNQILTIEIFVRHLGDAVLPVFPKRNNIVDVRAIADKLFLLQRRSDETLLQIGIQLHIRHRNHIGLNGIESPNLRLPFLAHAKFLQQALVIVHRIIHQIVQVIFHLNNIILQPLDIFVRLETIELRNPFNFYLRQPSNIVLYDFPAEQLLIRLQTFVDGSQHRFPRLALFNVAVDSLFDENLLQR